MQQAKVWQKTGFIRTISFGTALSIVLQITSCYAIAYADTTSGPPASTAVQLASADIPPVPQTTGTEKASENQPPPSAALRDPIKSSSSEATAKSQITNLQLPRLVRQAVPRKPVTLNLVRALPPAAINR